MTFRSAPKIEFEVFREFGWLVEPQKFTLHLETSAQTVLNRGGAFALVYPVSAPMSVVSVAVEVGIG